MVFWGGGDARAASFEAPVDIRRTFLATDSFDVPLSPVIIDLQVAGFVPGGRIYLTITGQGCIWNTTPPTLYTCPMR